MTTCAFTSMIKPDGSEVRLAVLNPDVRNTAIPSICKDEGIDMKNMSLDDIDRIGKCIDEIKQAVLEGNNKIAEQKDSSIEHFETFDDIVEKCYAVKLDSYTSCEFLALPINGIKEVDLDSSLIEFFKSIGNPGDRFKIYTIVIRFSHCNLPEIMLFDMRKNVKEYEEFNFKARYLFNGGERDGKDYPFKEKLEARGYIIDFVNTDWIGLHCPDDKNIRLLKFPDTCEEAEQLINTLDHGDKLELKNIKELHTLDITEDTFTFESPVQHLTFVDDLFITRNGFVIAKEDICGGSCNSYNLESGVKSVYVTDNFITSSCSKIRFRICMNEYGIPLEIFEKEY